MNDDNQGREREVKQRIASLMQSIGPGTGKPISGDEAQKLKAAAGRLDQMLKDAGEAEREALKEAAGRLDRLLIDIRKGKDVANRIKRRGQPEPER
jgi:hypothetical protein